MHDLAYTLFRTAIGPCGIAWGARGVVALQLPEASESATLARLLRRHSGAGLRRPALERTTGAVDVVHATTLIVPPSRAPLVVTVHDLAFVHQSSDFTRHGVAAFERGLAIVREHASLVLCSSLTTLGRDQGIFQYVAYAIQKGAVDYRDVRDVNGPLTHLVHLIFLSLGGRDEHQFRLLDMVVDVPVLAGHQEACRNRCRLRQPATTATAPSRSN